MGLDISKYKTTSTKDFGRAEDGNYPARLVQIVELGIQPMEDWQTGEAKDPKPRCFLTFEFPTELIEVGGEEKPRWYGKEYTISAHELAGMLKVVKALDPAGEEMDLTKLIGKPCMVEIGTTSTGKPKIVSVSKLMKGVSVDELANAPVVVELDDLDKAAYGKLPDWLKEKITGALDYEGSDAQLVIEAGTDGGAF